MRIIQSHSFEKSIKKLSAKEKQILDDAVRKIAEQPLIGERKKGDLRDVFVYKFKIKTALHLLAYRRIRKDLELISVGPHENYYRDLKRQIRK